MNISNSQRHPWYHQSKVPRKKFPPDIFFSQIFQEWIPGYQWGSPCKGVTLRLQWYGSTFFPCGALSLQPLSWWLSFNPFEKYAQVKLDSSSLGIGLKPPTRDEHKKYLSCHHPVKDCFMSWVGVTVIFCHVLSRRKKRHKGKSAAPVQ